MSTYTCRVCKASLQGDWAWLIAHLRDHYRELVALFYEIPDKQTMQKELFRWFEGKIEEVTPV